MLNSKAKQYPSHYTEDRMDTYRQHIAEGRTSMDCLGMIKGFFWTSGGTAENVYKRDCPDKSANGMLEWLQKSGCQWGTLDNIPDVPGILVFLPGHVGVYIGGGYVVEARGFSHGVVKTKLANRPWKHWAYLPDDMIDYAEKTTVRPSIMDWQKAAVADGYNFPQYGVDGEWGVECASVARTAIVKKRGTYTHCNLTRLVQAVVGVTVDGKCGSDTDKAIRAYQEKHGLEVDGEVGLNTWKKILNI
jgi:peptidoglycan hydrolase-like protein with peptidoglycan-binding domain